MEHLSFINSPAANGQKVEVEYVQTLRANLPEDQNPWTMKKKIENFDIPKN